MWIGGNRIVNQDNTPSIRTSQEKEFCKNFFSNLGDPLNALKCSAKLLRQPPSMVRHYPSSWFSSCLAGRIGEKKKKVVVVHGEIFPVCVGNCEMEILGLWCEGRRWMDPHSTAITNTSRVTICRLSLHRSNQDIERTILLKNTRPQVLLYS